MTRITSTIGTTSLAIPIVNKSNKFRSSNIFILPFLTVFVSISLYTLKDVECSFLSERLLPTLLVTISLSTYICLPLFQLRKFFISILIFSTIKWTNTSLLYTVTFWYTGIICTGKSFTRKVFSIRGRTFSIRFRFLSTVTDCFIIHYC